MATIAVTNDSLRVWRRQLTLRVCSFALLTAIPRIGIAHNRYGSMLVNRRIAYVAVGCVKHCEIRYSDRRSLAQTVCLLNSRGNIAVVRTVLAKGADPNVMLGKSAVLVSAIALWDKNAVMALVDSGADVNVHCDPAEITPLILAASDRDSAVLSYLLRHGARPNESNREGRTALMIAVAANNVVGVRSLLHFGANPHQKAKDGSSAVGLAKKGRNRQIKKLLGSREK